MHKSADFKLDAAGTFRIQQAARQDSNAFFCGRFARENLRLLDVGKIDSLAMAEEFVK